MQAILTDYCRVASQLISFQPLHGMPTKAYCSKYCNSTLINPKINAVLSRLASRVLQLLSCRCFAGLDSLDRLCIVLRSKHCRAGHQRIGTRLNHLMRANNTSSGQGACSIGTCQKPAYSAGKQCTVSSSANACLPGVVGADAAVNLDPRIGTSSIAHLPQLPDLLHLRLHSTSVNS
jgi:hypothetical protein